MLTPTVPREVEVLRWPSESTRRELCTRHDIPCLLLLEDGVAPPFPIRLLEDWIRVPADELDLVARVRRLDALSSDPRPDRPTLDEEGILHLGSRWTALSAGEAALARRLVASFGLLVRRDELLAALDDSPDRRPRTVDLQICRLRRRIEPFGLIVSAIRGRGYVMDRGDLAGDRSATTDS